MHAFNHLSKEKHLEEQQCQPVSPVLYWELLQLELNNRCLCIYYRNMKQEGNAWMGSPAGFYYSPPPSGSSNLWVIYLKGGGACHDEQSCTQRANSSLGSSKYWAKTYNPSKSVNSDNPAYNPYFYQGHQVYAPYCRFVLILNINI